MTWMSLNPKTEPFSRKYAALLLSQKWEYTPVTDLDNLSPTELAELYNNVEALGLDLNSLDRIRNENVKDANA